MFPGYLSLGGTIVLDQGLSYALIENSDCPPGWIRCTPCPGIDDALGMTPTDLVVENAPWYDAEDPATHRFLGLYPVLVDGAEGSTRTATITEGILDGGVVQGTRKAVRQVRVQGVMVGNGHDALDAGLAWLDAVLDGDHCSTHPGGGCGEVDACYFITCPPERGVTPGYTPWTITRTNQNTNPRLLTTTGWSVGASITSAADPGGTRLDFGLGLGSNVAILSQSAVAAALPNQTWAGSVEVQVPTGFPALTLYVTQLGFTSGGAAIGSPVPGPAVTIQPGQTIRLSSALFTAPATTAGVRTILAASTAVPIGARMIVRNALHEQAAATAGPYFDGTTAETELTRGTWSGTPDASVSWFETRGTVDTPWTDAEYDAVLDPLRRRLHGVTAISGPLVLRHFNRGHYHAYEVEFTLAAATPYVFNMPRRLSLAPTTPGVVQDSPFNLVTHPSAELAEAADLVVATNYATNPSLEVDATGWTTSVSGGIAAGNVTGARSIELSSAGLASFKSVFTAPGNGGPGKFGGQHELALPGITATSRYSVNLWSVASVQSGTAVLGDIEYHAVWMNASSVVLRDDLLGTRPAAGGPVSVKSIQPPAGTTKVAIRALANVTSWSTGAIVRLYTDAVAVTAP